MGSYLLTTLGIMFWIFRGVVAAMETIEKEFICTTLNLQLEIIILFATLPCMLLIIKRNLVGATLYLGIYGAYFGTALYNSLIGMNGAEGLTISNTISLLSSILGIIIPVFTFLDILLNRYRRNVGLDKKTEWYYNNERFDREYDERADRNQYKIR